MKIYKTLLSMNNWNERMISGMSVTIETTTETIGNALVVPIEAVFSDEEKTICYVRNKNKIEKRFVKTGKSNDDFVELIEGLTEGEEVSLVSQEIHSALLDGKENKDFIDAPARKESPIKANES